MRVSGNTPYIRTPRVQKRSSKRTLIIMLVTIVFPPLGLILLWRVARCPLRGKVLISALGALIMVFAFMVYIGSITPTGVNVPIEYQFLSITTPPAQSGVDGVVAPPPAEILPQEDDGEPEEIDLENLENENPSDVIPASPEA